MKCFEQRTTIQAKVEALAKDIKSKAEFFDKIALRNLQYQVYEIFEDLDDRRLRK